MTNYLALIDGKPGAYGVVFPDAPGCTAMGDTVEEALRNAREALSEWLAQESSETGLGIPKVRTEEELRADPELVEQLKDGAVLRGL